MHTLREKLRINYLTDNAYHISMPPDDDLAIHWSYFTSTHPFLPDLPCDSNIPGIGNDSDCCSIMAIGRFQSR